MIGRLGVTRASLGSEVWHVFVMGFVYFGVMLWDNYCRTFSGFIEFSMVRGIVVSLIDGYIYYYILQALLHTIRELGSMKQTSKLEVFKKLRTLYIVVVIISALYSLFFGYLLSINAIEGMWKWAWFFSSAIWSVISICLLCVVMVEDEERVNCSTCGLPTSDLWHMPTMSRFLLKSLRHIISRKLSYSRMRRGKWRLQQSTISPFLNLWKCALFVRNRSGSVVNRFLVSF